LKKIVYFFLSLVLSILFAIIVFNLLVDRAGIFNILKNNQAVAAAKIISNGDMAAGLSDFDERELQRYNILYQKNIPDIVAVGSSRTMQLRSEYIIKDSAKKHFFNHSVSGASLEDYISILGLYKQKYQKFPQTVILGIDPWVFNANNGQNRWIGVSDGFNYLAAELNEGIKKQPIVSNQKIFELINLEYTTRNIDFLPKVFTKKVYTTKTINIDDFIKKQDGSVCYPYAARKIADIDTIKSAKKYIEQDVYSLEHFDKLSNTLLFEKLIALLRRDNVQIVLIMPPYHPIVYSHLANNKKYVFVLETENYIRNFAKNNNIIVLGSYNPSINGFTGYDFTDGMHGKESVMQKLFDGMQED
jgi:hypothetical protein